MTDIQLDDAFSDFEYAAEAYRLGFETPAVSNEAVTEEGTVGQAIAAADGIVAVTFSRDCAEAYPSVQLLAPGHPLLEPLLEAFRNRCEQTQRLARQTAGLEEGSTPVVAGWGRKQSLARLTGAGGLDEETAAEVIDTWAEQFRMTRAESVTHD